MTVVGTRKRVDVALPSVAPVGEYAGRLADMCGQDTHDVFPPAWSLARAGAAPLALETSLAAAGITDGSVLYLTDIAADPAGEPVIEDIDELVADETARRRQRIPSRGTVLAVVSLLWLAGTSVLVAVTGTDALAGGVSLTLGALGLLVGAWTMAQKRAAVPPLLCVAMSVTAAVLMAGAGALVTQAIAGNDSRWTGAIAGGNLGLVMALAATPEMVLVAIEIQLLVAGLLAPLLLFLDTNRVQAASVVVVVAVTMMGAAKGLAAGIAAWGSRAPGSRGPMAQAVTNMLDRAGQLMSIVIGGPVVALIVSLPILATAGHGFAYALTVVTTVGLLLRVQQAGTGTEIVQYALAGLVGVFSAVLGLAHWLGGGGLVAALLTTGGLAVLCVGLGIVLSPIRPERDADLELGGAVPPPRRSKVEVVLMICNLATAPLAMGAFGIFGELIDLGRRLGG
ncbi:EsaB/YukD family protein [Virgisporangium aliadipatigenens]|uniref:EsaB/YukD family protein n=1 Tax=Virgisporangium aliadipatigenens TaxID=741659 RepID=UPI00194386B5|nr:EsaB/YukD family protein [Virgisporangium aliadipatigenens]